MERALGKLRVADFTWAWAGPYGCMLLADMGAEVIQIETYPREHDLRLNPPYAPDRPAGDLNWSGWFAANHRGVLSCTLNLKHPKGLELAKRIVGISDLVMENFSPGVMNRLGLGYEALKQVKPDIIFVSLSGYGATGPDSARISYGTHLHMSAGLSAITGYPGDDDTVIQIPYADPIGGLTGVFAALAALHYRFKTGEGQYIDVSQCESLASLIPEALMDYTINHHVWTRRGNHDDVMAPHGCYKCQGEESWVAIAVSTEAEWRGLCKVMGDPKWTKAERFSNGLSRWKTKKNWTD